MKTIFTLLMLLVTITFSLAGEKSSDDAAKKQLLGYWKSPRHGYLIKSNGIMYMCPRKECKTTNEWTVKDGKFYQDDYSYEIISLTDKKFVYRSTDKEHVTFTLVRTTEKEAEGE